MPVLTLVQGAINVQLNNIAEARVRRPASTPIHPVPGTTGGRAQFMDTPPDSFEVSGFESGSGAKAKIDNFNTMIENGGDVTVTYTAHGQNWINGLTYKLADLDYAVVPGRSGVAGAERVRFRLLLVRSV